MPNLQNPRKNWSILIANCSAHRPPTEMVLYFLKSSGQGLSKKYRTISVGGLWTEQFARKKYGGIHRPPVEREYFKPLGNRVKIQNLNL